MNAIPLWLDVLMATLLVIGAAFALIGSWGLAKLKQFMLRVHAPTKATTLGVGCVLIVSMIYLSVARGTVAINELLITLFLFMTAPISAHLITLAAFRLDPTLRDAKAKQQTEADRQQTPGTHSTGASDLVQRA
jgi:multicomponent K+:H+ antiporter subunit G